MCFLFNPEVFWARTRAESSCAELARTSTHVRCSRLTRRKGPAAPSGENLQTRGPARIYRRFGGIFLIFVYKKTPVWAFVFYSASGISLGTFTIILPPWPVFIHSSAAIRPSMWRLSWSLSRCNSFIKRIVLSIDAIISGVRTLFFCMTALLFLGEWNYSSRTLHM